MDEAIEAGALFKCDTMDELEEAIESLVDDDILDDENNFNDTSAWAETYNHDNWDGKIIEIDI